MSELEQYELHVLGTPDLRGPDGRRVSSVLAQPRRLGLLTYLALAPGPVARSRIVADFWPESDEDQARNNLSQAVYYLRRSLDRDVVRSVAGDRLWAPPERLWCDARGLLDSGRPAPALAESAPGELLSGWLADDSQPLQEWLDAQRAKLRDRAAALEAEDGDRDEAGAVDRPTQAGPTEPPLPPPLGRWAARPGALGWAAILVAMVVTIGAAAAWLGRPAPAAEALPAPRDLAVLLPSVQGSPGAPTLGEQAILDEVLAELAPARGLRVVEASYATSIQDFRRLLSRLEAADRDVADWVLAVSVRVSGERSRVTAILYGGSGFEVAGEAAFDVAHGSPEAAMLETPQEVAARVAEMVGVAVASRDD